jgi:hypothetical protein
LVVDKRKYKWRRVAGKGRRRNGLRLNSESGSPMMTTEKGKRGKPE